MIRIIEDSMSGRDVPGVSRIRVEGEEHRYVEEYVLTQVSYHGAEVVREYASPRDMAYRYGGISDQFRSSLHPPDMILSSLDWTARKPKFFTNPKASLPVISV